MEEILHHLGCTIKNLANDGINYQPQPVRRISEPSTVVSTRQQKTRQTFKGPEFDKSGSGNSKLTVQKTDNRINPKMHLPMTLGPIHYNIDQHKMSGHFKPRPFYPKNFTTSFHHFDLKHFSVHHDFSMAPIGLSSPARSHKCSWNATKECPERFFHSAWSTNCVQVLPSSASSWLEAETLRRIAGSAPNHKFCRVFWLLVLGRIPQNSGNLGISWSLDDANPLCFSWLHGWNCSLARRYFFGSGDKSHGMFPHVTIFPHLPFSWHQLMVSTILSAQVVHARISPNHHLEFYSNLESSCKKIWKVPFRCPNGDFPWLKVNNHLKESKIGGFHTDLRVCPLFHEVFRKILNRSNQSNQGVFPFIPVQEEMPLWTKHHSLVFAICQVFFAANWW